MTGRAESLLANSLRRVEPPPAFRRTREGVRVREPVLLTESFRGGGVGEAAGGEREGLHGDDGVAVPSHPPLLAGSELLDDDAGVGDDDGEGGDGEAGEEVEDVHRLHENSPTFRFKTHSIPLFPDAALLLECVAVSLLE